MIRLGLLVAVMTLVVPDILMVRVATVYDWFATTSLQPSRSPSASTKYKTVSQRRVYDDTWNLLRGEFVEFGPPVQMLQRILVIIEDGVTVGSSLGETVFCLMLLKTVGHLLIPP